MPAPAQHILICFHDFAPGGTERVALVLAREWVAAGRAVTILCGLAEGPSRKLVDPRIRVVELDPPIPRSPTSRLGLGRAMAARIAALKPDVAFLPGNFHFGIARALKRAAPGLPVVAKVSNPLLPALPALTRPLLQPLARKLLGAYVRPIDALIHMAPELAKAEAAELERTRDVVIAEPNLPAGHTPPPRGEPSDPPTVLVIGRMEPQKNLALALRAFAELRRKRAARLVVLGEGSQRPRLEALTRELGIAGDVAMPGYSTETEQHLSSASALLLTSRCEGYPAVVSEALAADVPVVATACTPVLDSLLPSQIHGRIVAENTPQALAEALDAALDLPFASGGLRPAGVAHHDAAASARAYLDLFDRLAL
ncbi:MAG: glycosyltransferase [Sphingomonadales bacterium]|nr:glycosyltransferase [Sphingomonadales bacterium]MBU3991927.1 glycosyltransferase [Alphaproteobacteria bacterium]